MIFRNYTLKWRFQMILFIYMMLLFPFFPSLWLVCFSLTQLVIQAWGAAPLTPPCYSLMAVTFTLQTTAWCATVMRQITIRKFFVCIVYILFSSSNIFCVVFLVNPQVNFVLSDLLSHLSLIYTLFHIRCNVGLSSNPVL